jgi:hypothetical protein
MDALLNVEQPQPRAFTRYGDIAIDLALLAKGTSDLLPHDHAAVFDEVPSICSPV